MANIKDLIKSISASETEFSKKLDSLQTMEETQRLEQAKIDKAMQDNVDLIVEAIRVMERKVQAQIEDAKAIIPAKGDQGPAGKDGRPGLDGKPGANGAAGQRGKDGVDGQDGVSVVDARIDFDGSLIISLSTGREINVGEVVAPDLAERIKVISTMSTNGAIGIKDEGSSISTGVKNINFVGATVTASASGDDVTVNVSAGTGTVTSVDVSGGTTGLTTSGGPITTTGSITLAGTLAVTNGGTGVTTSTGTGSVVLSNSPTLVTPNLGTPSALVGTNITGTAGLNINGTVGATTPSTVAATTLTTSSTVTLNGGTAYGVAYLDGDKVLTTGTALRFIEPRLSVFFANGSTLRLDRTGAGTSTIESIETGLAYRDLTLDAAHTIFKTSGIEVMRLTASGFGIGTSSPTNKLEVFDGNIVIRQSGAVSAKGFAFQLTYPPTQDGVNLGSLTFNAIVSGADYIGAAIQSYSTAAWTTSSTPAYLSFRTTAPNSTSPAERVVINSTGMVVTGTLSASSGITLTNLTASSAVATDASKNLVSVTNTGTGNNVLANSPTLVTPALGTPASGVVTNLTGTASININGTVGATTATTGAFTTLTTSSDVTLSGGTANGVTFLNGSKVLTSGSALTFDGTNFASTGSLTGSTLKSIRASGSQPEVVIQQTGVASWSIYNPPSSTDLRFYNGSDLLTLNSSSLYTASGINVGIGTSSPSLKLDVNGSAKFAGSYVSFNDNGYIRTDAANILRFQPGSGGYQFRNQSNSDNLAVLDASGNLGLGVTPSAWGAGYVAAQVGSASIFSLAGGSGGYYIGNGYFNGSAYVYQNTAAATRYEMVSGQHTWSTAPSGVANSTSITTGVVYVVAALGSSTLAQWQAFFSGLAALPTVGQSITATATGTLVGGGTVTQTITFTQAMTLDASGNLGVGATSPNNKLTVQADATGASFADNGVAQIIARGNTDSTKRLGLGIDTTNNIGVIQAQKFGTGTYPLAINPAGGNVGIGTSSPAAKLHVSGDALADTFKLIANTTVSGSDATIFRPADNTMAFSTNGAERARISSDGTFRVKGAGTAGSTDAFQVAGTAPADAARIDSSGNLLVGTTSVPSSSSGGAAFSPASVGRTLLKLGTTTTSGAGLAEFYNPNGMVGEISVSGSTTTYGTSSDYRLKNTIAPMTGALAKVALLKPCTYKWNADGSDGEGFIAHELAEVCPQAVTGEKDAVNEDGSIKAQGIDTSFLVATLTAALQELNAKFDAYVATHP